ncbi:colicin/pyocin immunity family protein [Yersinia thracica]|uniref:Colicin/pyocin immunity family protein n=1 Tax=Yersinia thracica TaxID=2890319 RepID=A0A0T9Q7X6_9GAMM|nr:colicin/pyocin immunity family protein [Yersinia thracica]
MENARLAAEAADDLANQRALIYPNTLFLPAYPTMSMHPPGFAAVGVGPIALSPGRANDFSTNLRKALVKFNTMATSELTLPPAVIIGTDPYLKKVSDKWPLVGSVPLREMGLSPMTQLPPRGEVELRVRILMKNWDDRTFIYAVKTYTVDVATKVKVAIAQFDRLRGVYTFTTDSQPPSTFIFTPTWPPGMGSGSGSVLPQPARAPAFPQHTGTDGSFFPSNLYMTFVSPNEVDFHDYIIWFPADSGLEPVYVYFNSPRKGVVDAGHDYHPSPRTEEITGFMNLSRSKRKTLKQGGTGKRERWIDQKGRKIYEWDSQHGELEGYRVSDGQHLGAFDYKTGVQLKPADPNRNIKKYL